MTYEEEREKVARALRDHEERVGYRPPAWDDLSDLDRDGYMHGADGVMPLLEVAWRSGYHSGQHDDYERLKAHVCGDEPVFASNPYVKEEA